jgi:hypothetical protein
VVGETGFVRLELELFSAEDADFCWGKHVRSMIRVHNALRKRFIIRNY